LVWSSPVHTIRAMTAADAAQVVAIYQDGIDTGQATFETTAPAWEEFDARRWAEHRFVAVDGAGGQQVLGRVAVSATPGRSRDRADHYSGIGRCEKRYDSVPRALTRQAVNDMSTPTEGADYARRLHRIGDVWWKRVLNVQAPYRAHVRRLKLGFTLDVGCGIGRNLSHLDGNGVGVDHNAEAIASVRKMGYQAYTVEEFHQSGYATAGRFDALLVSHVLEHMPQDAAVKLVEEYLPFVKPGGKVVFITPQERGYASDETHVEFVGFPEAAEIARQAGVSVEKQYSFPLPRMAGKVFTYNEFVLVGRIPRHSQPK
jgi:SAM-dependent methyltransferase